MNTAFRLVISLTLALLLTTTSASESAVEDGSTIQSIITATYAAISGPAGQPRDWNRFRALFAPQATLSFLRETPAGNIERVVMTSDSYIEGSGASLERNGFFETETHQVIEQFGNIAHVFSTYDSRRSVSDPEPFARGINSFQLMHDGSRWFVVSIYWQAESDTHPISTEYLPE